jgi:hypothetical protein
LKKVVLLVLVVTVVLGLLLLIAGCNENQAPEAEEVTFNQLFADPDKYNSNEITIEGFYFDGFEVIVLSESVEFSGYAQGHLIPEGKMVWVEGEIPQEVYDKLYQQQMMGPLERYGKVRVKGKFEYGAEYGHLGAYSAQIIPSEIEVLPWSPPGEQ